MHRRFLLSLVLLVIACSSSGPPAPSTSVLSGVPDQAAAAAIAAGQPPVGIARLVIVSGRWDDTGMGKTVLAREASVRGDIVVQGQRLAFFENGQAVAADLPAGTYLLQWEMRDLFSNAPNTLSWVRPIPIEVSLHGGRTTVFTADVIDRARVVGYFSITDALLGIHPPIDFRFDGTIATVLTPQEDARLLVERRPVILSPREERLASIPGARAVGR
ncbi:hypothetical protein [Neoroseomonas oryzicola]|uniref:Uncharacterized protein n=1 Tax=Neoroseomonas oryzicola TaxID=535904 RepID=A0A9X9WMU6_9PROT|nr:hypothetical protein [Neoroseomonas oryzicola]MBR0661656.1 hypothetical protein [Neoroseomonas oryzicola]NKE20177.1 hypothetical protein [Neoroseomonas oryzicola]